MKKKAIVLGGTMPHLHLIKKLKNRGYETILVDYLDNSPAKVEADRHIKESTLDKEAVLNIAIEEEVDLVLSACVDQANVTACYVSEKLGFPHPYSYETALNVTNKGRMKEILVKNDIPTSPYRIIEGADSIEKIKGLEFPLIVKPTDANSSKGVYIINNENEFIEKIGHSLEISRENRAIVEQFIKGTEIQVDCFAVNGEAHVLMVKDHIVEVEKDREVKSSGFVSPGPACTANMKQIEEVSSKIVTAFGLKTTPFFYEAICNEDGVFVLELAARCAGGTSYSSVGVRSGVDYLDLSLKAFLQEEVLLDINPNPKKIIGHFLHMKPGIFAKMEGMDELIENGIVDYVYPYAVAGQSIGTANVWGNCIAAIMILSDTYEEGIEKMQKALDYVKILDENHEDMSIWK